MAEGTKFDTDKLRVELLPVTGLLLQADVYTRGAKKYDDNNWRKGIKWTRILGAMMRHLLWYMAGETYDPEDGQHHLASLAWGANTLMEYEFTHKELDDRYIAVEPGILRQMINNMKKSKDK
ncbi:MAG TPA: dATP/dGTP diphosphohydrolase domain-containing protein [Nitrosopumilaceae archaeon]|nr:dATP/dGTP diphosphohydrolase domain-containing protein [Nitrosopumilaceae archaeon]